MYPTCDLERSLCTTDRTVVAGVDEVGRGALAGPVMVGIVAMMRTCAEPPSGLADSKLLTAHQREALVEPARQWAMAWATGIGTPQEIDEYGILVGLRLAGERALAALGVVPDVVILDGNYNWLIRPQRPSVADGLVCTSRIIVQKKADRDCSSVAAASVIAKVERDAMMRALHAEHPVFEWASNKGYGARVHMDAINEHGPTRHHRISWNLTGKSDR
ncbi:MAG: ribonuclease HII [Ilumatobacteraceae bacterium]|nr:ribonuclease HII [Ilumatobacteraceae bacterium]